MTVATVGKNNEPLAKGACGTRHRDGEYLV